MAKRSVIQAHKHPWVMKLLHYVPDVLYIRIKWMARRMPYRLRLRNPQTFNEKLQWLKLYDRNPLYTVLVDKYRVKQYVANIIGEDHVIKCLGVWNRVEDIEWDKLPNRFVIKCSHDCGGLVICKDKSLLDIPKAKEKLNASLKRNYYYEGREWPYKNVVPVVFAEEYMEDEFGELRDYKFFCFDGKARALMVGSERYNSEEVKQDYFDADYNHLPFTKGHPCASVIPTKPKGFEEMRNLAAELSRGIPEVRVDMYNINGKSYFGEFTFFHDGGMVEFHPIEWDYKFGSWINLPIRK